MRAVAPADRSRLASANGGAPSGNIAIGESHTGRGVFARRTIQAGETVLEFRGTVIDFAATLRKRDRESDALQIGPGSYLDLDPPGRYVNHSCDPNAGLRDCVRLVALRDIRADEEVHFDYCTTMDEDHWTMECRCGAPNCRGTVRDFKWLPVLRKLELIRQDVVPSFLVAREIERGHLSVSRGIIVAGIGEV